MDKTWIKEPIISQAYREGVKGFISFASEKAVQGIIKCPCTKCCNEKRWTCDAVHSYILKNGFLPGYTMWVFHGEKLTSSECDTPTPCTESSMPHSETMHDLRGLLRDIGRYASVGSNVEQVGEMSGLNDYGTTNADKDEEGGDIDGLEYNVPSDSQQPPPPAPPPHINATRYQKLLDKSEEELYSGCKYSKLAFNLHLYHLKYMGSISNKIFTMLLELLKDAFPFLTSLPSSTQEFKKLTVRWNIVWV